MGYILFYMEEIKMDNTLSKNKIAKLQRKQQELFDKFTRQLSEIEKMSSVESKYTQASRCSAA